MRKLIPLTGKQKLKGSATAITFLLTSAKPIKDYEPLRKASEAMLGVW